MKNRNLKNTFNRAVKLIRRRDIQGAIGLIRDHPDLKGFTDEDKNLLSATLDLERSYMEALLIEGVDPNLTDTTGSTLLMGASSLGELDTIKLLIKHGALVNKLNYNGESAFSFACARNRLECAKTLYNNGADVNVNIGCSGSRPLDWALRFSSEEFIDWLSTVGALRGSSK